MRAVLLVVLISAAFADDQEHYPTNHPGVCNILAFVSDHVDEVVHVAHDEVEEAVTEKSSKKSAEFIEEIKKVKRQVKDIMEVAQCLATDLEKEKIDKFFQKTFLATSVESQQAVKPREIQRSVRDVIHLLENYTENLEKQQGKTEQLKEEATQSAVQSESVSQHVAETQNNKRHVRDVVHLPKQTVEETKQIQTYDKTKQTLSHVAEVSDQSPLDVANSLRKIRNVAHVLETFLETTDTSKQIATQESSSNAEELLPATFEQHVAIQKRRKRNVVNVHDEEIKGENQNHHDSPYRAFRDVSHLLSPQTKQPYNFDNEVKVESSLQLSKSNYFGTADIISEETQQVAVEEAGGYADQLFPPIIGQPTEFQDRLRRNAVNIIKEDLNIPSKDSEHIALTQNSPRLVRDVVHLLDTYTTLANQEHLAATIELPAAIPTQASQHVAEQQSSDSVIENLKPILQENRAAVQTQGINIPQTSTSKDLSQVSQHVASKENDASIKDGSALHKRNVEIGRKYPISTATEENNVLKKKSKRSTDNVDSSSDHTLQSQQTPKEESQHYKYIQIVNPGTFSKRARRSHDETPTDYIKSVTKVEKSYQLPAAVIEPTQDSQYDANHNILNKRVDDSTDDSSDVSSSTSPQNPADSKEDVREFLKPTAKTLNPSLPLTQFASRNTIKKSR